MWNYFWPILVVISANTLYNITAKSTPTNVDLFVSLTITYLVAAMLSLSIFFMTSPTKNIVAELSKTNWTALIFGFAIVALEYGYINVYRAGWKISVGSLVANTGLACILLLVGILLYKESVSLRQLIGMVFGIVSLILISK